MKAAQRRSFLRLALGGRALFLRVGVQPFAALGLGLLAVGGEFALLPFVLDGREQKPTEEQKKYDIKSPEYDSRFLKVLLGHVNWQ